MKLIEANKISRNDLLEFLTGFDKSGISMFWNRNFKAIEDIDKYMELVQKYNSGEIRMDSGGMSKTFCLVDLEKPVGIINIRTVVKGQWLIRGGHIGYAVLESERGKGYGTQMLKLALSEAKKLGLSELLLTCDADNIGSYKTIEKAGGIFKDEQFYKGIKIFRYIIKLN